MADSASRMKIAIRDGGGLMATASSVNGITGSIATKTGYYLVIDGDKLKFFNADKQIVDSAFIRLADDKRTAIPGF